MYYVMDNIAIHKTLKHEKWVDPAMRALGISHPFTPTNCIVIHTSQQSIS